MSKKFSIIALVVLTVLLGTQIAISQLTRDAKDDLYQQIELFSYTLATVQSDYVEEKEAKDLIYGSLKGMLESLDPHSQFMDPDEYKELKTETQGKFGGLGIEISIRDGLLTVITPIEDTPAWEAGIKAGDRIVKIEDEVTKNISLSDAVKKLRGKPGTAINITVLREVGDSPEILEIEIIREEIRIRDIKHPQILKDDIGYIRLAEFRENSAKEFKKALAQLQTDGANSLVLDLRNNPGGLLSVAIEITEIFLGEGETIVSTKGRRISQNTVSKSSNKVPNDWPVVVLINGGSASGSEIVAGALKDNNRAVIVGEKSFGKGSVQSVIPMPDGSGLRLTTSKYYTPSGESIHEVGIEPDVVVVRKFEEERGEEDSKKDGEKVDEVFSAIEDDSDDDDDDEETEDPEVKRRQETKERLLKDNQVQAAMGIINGIKVYQQF